VETLSVPCQNQVDLTMAVPQALAQPDVDSGNPLLREGILTLTLDLVGTAEALYIRGVNSSWKACYDNRLPGQQADEEGHAHTSSCTSYQAALASVSRLTLAHEASGLRLHETSELLQISAGMYADIGTLKAANDLGLVLTPAVMFGAANSRCLSKLQLLHTEQHCPFPDDITVIAARAGDVEMLRWLQETGCELNEETSAGAAETANNLHVLKYLHDQGCPWHPALCAIAGATGDLEQLKWLHAHGAAVNSTTADEAACGGAVHVLEWLQQQQGVEFSEQTLMRAAEGGHLQLCQWLRAQQCPWNTHAAGVAAWWNYSTLLRWLLDSGCPYDTYTLCMSAVIGPCDDVFSTLQCLYERDIVTDTAVLTDMLAMVGSQDNLAVAKWLKVHGAEWPPVLCSRLGPWYDAVIEWARAEGCTSPVEELQ
jgi:hypothetical protein